MPISRSEMSADDKRFQAESDARAMAEAQVIQGDKPRMKAAQGAAKKMATEATEKAQAMNRVAKRQPPKGLTKSNGGKNRGSNKRSKR